MPSIMYGTIARLGSPTRATSQDIRIPRCRLADSPDERRAMLVPDRKELVRVKQIEVGDDAFQGLVWRGVWEESP